MLFSLINTLLMNDNSVKTVKVVIIILFKIHFSFFIVLIYKLLQ